MGPCVVSEDKPFCDDATDSPDNANHHLRKKEEATGRGRTGVRLTIIIIIIIIVIVVVVIMLGYIPTTADFISDLPHVADSVRAE